MALTKEVIAAIGLVGQITNIKRKVARWVGLYGDCPSCNSCKKRKAILIHVRFCPFHDLTFRRRSELIYFSNFYKPPNEIFNFSLL
jgi:hypothetical protein